MRKGEPLRVVHRDGIFMLENTTPDDAQLLKRIPFRWHGGSARCYGGCSACAVGMPFRAWWTNDPERVVTLARALRGKRQELAVGDVALRARIDRALKGDE
jgi:hypothetical protein